ncbi:hypothetical protein UFOVP361_155 [uncultured Caudovirales phage]|uniref:Tail fiber protein n=1 Tax=uncultured Caudovirales phage TaxID=2100421 RepID=A0A6J7WZL7_9CAUD|nr:hypothetical protein UFOVP361_155 [uncultured Caudovirales phage]
MAQKFLTNIDLNQNQLVNATFEVLGTDPSSGNFEGRLIYNSTTDTIKVYANSAWRSLPHTIASGGSYTDGITISESNGTVTLTLNLADTDSAGLLSSTFWNTLNDATDAATASKLAKRDANGNITVATPTADGHAATKGYVDAARSGLDVKQSVRAATTAPINLANQLENGDTLDTNVTLATGDRVLVKDQSTASENGIYVVNATGAPTRATDFDTTAEVTPGAFTFVEEGTTNADSGWVLTSNGTITVGTTGLTFAQFSGAGQITAGDGLTKTGNTINAVGTADRITVNADSIDIASTYAGQSTITTLGTVTTGTWSATAIAVAKGGTAATTESGARTNLASASSEASGRTTSTPALARVAKQGCAVSSAGVSTTVVTHNFGTTDVNVQIYEVSTGATVIGDVTRSNGNSLSVVLYGTIAANDYTIVVVG